MSARRDNGKETVAIDRISRFLGKLFKGFVGRVSGRKGLIMLVAAAGAG